MLKQMLKPPKMLFVAFVAMIIAPFLAILLIFAVIFTWFNPDWNKERARFKSLSKEDREQENEATAARIKMLLMPFWHRLNDWIEG